MREEKGGIMGQRGDIKFGCASCLPEAKLEENEQEIQDGGVP